MVEQVLSERLPKGPGTPRPRARGGPIRLTFKAIRHAWALNRILLGCATSAIRGDREGARRKGRALRYQVAHHLLRREAHFITFRRGGLEWTAYLHDSTISPALFEGGHYQADSVGAVVEWLNRRGALGADRPAIVDAGANIGTTSLPLAVATGKRVIAVEPVPDNFDLLRFNALRNGLGDRIACVRAAVSASPGELEMVIDPGNCGNSTVGGLAGLEDRGFARIVVPSRPLEAIVAAQGLAPGQVALVWSDTQGFEREVIESGRALWAAGVPVFLELWPEGLRAQGGLESFADRARECFATMVSGADLLCFGPEAEVHPIEDLIGMLRDLDARHGEADALLLPHGWDGDRDGPTGPR